MFSDAAGASRPDVRKGVGGCMLNGCWFDYPSPQRIRSSNRNSSGVDFTNSVTTDLLSDNHNGCVVDNSGLCFTQQVRLCLHSGKGSV